jgi:hypothetical protein
MTAVEDRFADAEYRLQIGRTMLRRALDEAWRPSEPRSRPALAPLR